MAVADFQVTVTGNRRIVHNGLLAHSARKLSLDPANPTTVLLLAKGYISSTVTATTYEGDPANLHTYTVTTAGGGKVNFNLSPLAQAQTLALDPGDPTAIELVAKGYIS